MKEIKFRQLLIDGTWHYWGYIDGHFVAPVGLNNSSKPSQQFTGLKDKNGVEIYEGDIVRCTTRKKEDKRKLDESFISEVFWDIDTFLVHDSPNCDSPIGTYDGNNKKIITPVNPAMEVIGNIYENSELLK